MNVLPAREPPLEGESLAGVVRRNALAMGYERIGLLRGVLTQYGTPPTHLDHLEPGPAMDGRGELLAVSPSRLRAATVHNEAANLQLVPRGDSPAASCDSRTILRFVRSASPPFCPRCLGEGIPYERLSWSFRPFPICPVHHALLVERCPECGCTPSPARLDVRRCRCGFDLVGAVPVPVSPAVDELGARVRQWLNGERRPWPDVSTCAVFHWLERLRSAIARTPVWLLRIRERLDVPTDVSDESICWLSAIEMLSSWPDRFEEFLDEYQVVARHRTCDSGVGRSFGTLLREATRFEELGHSAPADVLRRYLAARYTGGHVGRKVGLFRGREHGELLEGRPWITRTEAASRLGLSQRSLPGLMERGLLEGEVHQAGRRAMGLVSRESVEALQRELESALTVPAVTGRLGVGRRSVHGMIHADLLGRVVRTARGWLVPEESVEEWLRLLHPLPVRGRSSKDWITTREATRRFGAAGLTMPRLLELLGDGRVRAVRRNEAGNFADVLVHRADLEEVRPELHQWRSAVAGWTLNRLARELVPGRPLKDVVLRKWIDAGLLRAERKGRVWRITAEEVDRFRREYCLADEACRLLGVVRTTLSRWEDAGRITAVYGRRAIRGAGLSVFRRHDVERLVAERSSIGS